MNEVIQEAIDKLTVARHELDGKITQLKTMITGPSPAPTAPRTRKPKAEAPAGAAPVTGEAPAPGKRVMTAEGKARIAAAQKKRWAAVRAGQAAPAAPAA